MRVSLPLLLTLVAALALSSLCGALSGVWADDGAAKDLPLLDQVHLKNGTVFEGRIVREGDGVIVLDLESESGGRGRMKFPLARIRRVIRGCDRGTVVAGHACVRDAWFLLSSGGNTVGTRHLRLRHRRGTGGYGWQLEDDIVQFARGAHVPATRVHRLETTDLAFFPVLLHHREVDEASVDSRGPRRYERVLTGPIRCGMWSVLVREGAAGEQRQVAIRPGLRGRLGTREDLLRRRQTGLRNVEFFDAATARPKTVRAGYTALNLQDACGASYDEFVWEEDGTRLVSRFREAEALEEWVTEGVVAVPVVEAQAEAATAEADRRVREGEENVVRLPELGLTLRLPGDTWTKARVEVPPGTKGWRHVAHLESRYFVADARIEWDPEGVHQAPSEAEAEARLLQRLRAVCPDLRVIAPRAPLGTNAPNGWRLGLRGTLKGERIRTVAVVVARGQGRALILVACPETAWGQAAPSIERLLHSIEVM